jgi:sirohydrochlorin cobaltochelatase
MTMGVEIHEALELLDRRLKTLLPEEYQDSYEDVQPVSMGSAGLKYDSDGRVAWHEIWQTFCDLAMAGGPPHKGALLEPAPRADIEAQPERYDEVTQEICRAVTMVSDLWARPAPAPGWVRVTCFNDGMAGWLVRAIVMENVAARSEGATLDLPAGPQYRLEKEIKNVVTVMAKTCHYWVGHIPRSQQRAIADLFRTLADEGPLVEPAWSSDGRRPPGHDPHYAGIATSIARDTGLRASTHRYAGWLGLECPTVRAAIWMMRALVTLNVLSRREGTVLFVPVNPARDPSGAAVVRSVATVHGLAVARAIV